MKLINTNDLAPEQVDYIKTRFFDTLYLLDKLAIENKHLFYWLRFLILVVGALIPVFTNLDLLIPSLDLKFSRIIVTVISLIPVISFSFLQVFKNDKMWIHHRTKFEMIKCELYRFLNLCGHYQRYDSQRTAYPYFVCRVEEMFEQEIKDYFQSLDIENSTGLVNL